MLKYPKKIYAIQHNITKRMYIGATKNVEGRYRDHIYALRKGQHGVEDMQTDFDIYGEDYSLYILGEIASGHERRKEYDLIRKYRTQIRGFGYNYKDRAVVKKYTPDHIPLKPGLPQTKTKGK